MNPERWRKVDAIFQAALDRAPEERAAFLVEVCGTDDALRREVEALLAADAQAASLLERPAYVAAAPFIEETPPSLVGTLLAHYRVLAFVGKGGMGEVYRARDTRLDREVALKILPLRVAADAERMQRFIREAKAASALNHPHVATIYEIGEAPIATGSVNFIAMEFIAGKRLDTKIEAGPLPLSDVVRIGCQIADAMDEAHSKGITHRDIKPANIMLTERGHVKVLDFGLAKVTQSAAGSKTDGMASTVSGIVMGTAPYMSPEQATGRTVDHRSDIFSLGIVLYEMITGRRPFTGDTPSEIIAAVLRDEPPPLPAKTSSELGRIVEKALWKNREDRYQSVKDLLKDLKAFEPKGPTEIKSGNRPSWFSPFKVRAVLPVMIVLLAAGAGAFWWAARKSGPPPIIRPIPLTSLLGDELNPAISPDGKQVAFAWNGEKRENYDLYVKLVGAGTPLRLTTHPAEDLSPAWSPDGTAIAFLRRVDVHHNELMLIPALSGPERKLTEVNITEDRALRRSALAWSPDIGRRWLVVSHREEGDPGEGLFLVFEDTGEKRRLTRPPENYQRDFAPSISPNGRKIVFFRMAGFGSTGDLYLLSLSDELMPQGEPQRLNIDEPYAVSPVWSPDGRYIFYLSAPNVGARERTELRKIDALGKGPPERVQTLVGEVREMSLGRHLVYARADDKSDIWRAEIPPTGKPPNLPSMFISSPRGDNFPKYSPDGKKIAFESSRSGTPELYVADADGSNPLKLTSFGGTMIGYRNWSPDSQHLVFHARPEGQADLFMISASGGVPRRLTTGSYDEAAPCYSLDGRWIYFTSTRSGQPEIWRMPAEGGDPVKLTTVGGRHPILSPDGKNLYFAPLNRDQGFWKMPVDGGEPISVTGPLSDLYTFVVGKEGLFYVPAPEPGHKNSIRLLSSLTGKSRTVVLSDSFFYGPLTVSPNQRFLAFSLRNYTDDELILIENFDVR